MSRKQNMHTRNEAPTTLQLLAEEMVPAEARIKHMERRVESRLNEIAYEQMRKQLEEIQTMLLKRYEEQEQKEAAKAKRRVEKEARRRVEKEAREAEKEYTPVAELGPESVSQPSIEGAAELDKQQVEAFKRREAYGIELFRLYRQYRIERRDLDTWTFVLKREELHQSYRQQLEALKTKYADVTPYFYFSYEEKNAHRFTKQINNQEIFARLNLLLAGLLNYLTQLFKPQTHSLPLTAVSVEKVTVSSIKTSTIENSSVYESNAHFKPVFYSQSSLVKRCSRSRGEQQATVEVTQEDHVSLRPSMGAVSSN